MSELEVGAPNCNIENCAASSLHHFNQNMRKRLVTLLLLLLFVSFSHGVRNNLDVSTVNQFVKARKASQISKVTRVSTLLTANALLSLPQPSRAVQGKVGTSSLEDTKAAVRTIQAARDSTNDMEKLAYDNDYAGVAKLLNSKLFRDLEPAFTTLVRSDAISSEDKISLGTIKRYGTVADALIMLGGLTSELRAGGYTFDVEKPKLEQAIEDYEEEEEKKTLDPSEVKRYIKLTHDSLNDIYRIGLPVLNK